MPALAILFVAGELLVFGSARSQHPDWERVMAKRMNAEPIELASCHVMMLSHPAEVVKVIEEVTNSK
jgi:hypothetical protein